MNFTGELLGTFILVLLGDGVVSACILNKTKAQNSGWIAIVLGWGIAVTVAVYISGFMSGAHLNPAVTLAMAAIGSLPWSQVVTYLVAQFLGAMLGALVLYLHYYPHWKETKDAGTILACFSTGPAIRHTWSNLLGEALGTAVLVITVMAIGPNKVAAGFGPIIVGFVVMAVGFSLGATTGYAINPARDLGPRIMHALLPIPNKGDSDWSYAWIPVLGPILGGIAGALIYQVILNMM
ncbi:glycerol transporter [Streptococcus dysgalactiae subsp. equisimilis]|uniref:MIP/aquaporin family protein n=2 Tax=Streptococcus dysgalactiae TaxID=1334 RepID=A0AB38Y334_STREQ|nr:MIP/aquaporin family protein [Streptococcus dysgalactiae]EGR89284.1 MIP family channel protein [Streptococcus dysgalactiae subsp. equisimilis SK1250]BAN93003.1 glycerol uptake facilitator protein [Streptococcus dysgalactiae subsp. equisimilis 167]KKC21121.1 glycerol transporter [Streptococcus dysgalactiae subsp. equisimilis]MBM6514739.1 aquaporin family protein [Streptococcus dysgalactiae subsp. equisimilis]MBM6534374.1 aquaporin family protein [Streptococcus dysgalactiae subsp. equisimilis